MAQDGHPNVSSNETGEPALQNMHIEIMPNTSPRTRNTELANNVTAFANAAASRITGGAGGPDVSAFRGMLEASIKDVKNQYHYEKAGYLEKHEAGPAGKETTWTTTRAFHQANFLFLVYKDIKQYVEDNGITEAELKELGSSADIKIHRKKDFRDPITQLWWCCRGTAVRNVTESDIAAHFDQLPYGKIAKFIVEKALHAEADRQRQSGQGLPVDGQRPGVSLVLGRVLVLATMCGIIGLQLPDFAIILAKAGLFETVMRSRIAALRNHHPSQIINTLLFGGKTESHGTVFVEQDGRAYTLVGRIVKPGSATFNEPWNNCYCVFLSAEDIKSAKGKKAAAKYAQCAAGTPIYMPTAWARLLQQREAPHLVEKSKKPTIETLHFVVSATSNGHLLAQPFSSPIGPDLFFIRSAPRERHYGGLVGQPSCGCTPKGNEDLAKSWHICKTNLTKGTNIVRHPQEVYNNEIRLLDHRGDWPTAVFLMQALAQSSYLQGKVECVNCAVQNAALKGCLQVILCSNGAVRS